MKKDNDNEILGKQSDAGNDDNNLEDKGVNPEGIMKSLSYSKRYDINPKYHIDIKAEGIELLDNYTSDCAKN